MSFLHSSILWNLLWIVPVFAAFWIAGDVRRRKLLLKLFGTQERISKFADFSNGKRIFRMILLACIVILVVIAAARPSWGKRIMEESSSGRDLLVVFDVSRSMLADDVKPDRMEHAKWLVRELVKQNPGDRFGLIAFAGTAFLSCPLTMDRTSFVQLVNDLDTRSIPLGGTNIQKALETAVTAFKGAEGSHKAVILITDGDELEGRSSSVVSDLAESGIPLFIAGIGDPSVPAVIRVKDEKGETHILTDASGNTVKSMLNEEQLADLARRTGGIYVRSTTADSGISPLESRIQQLDRKSSDNNSMFRPIERPVYPLAAALILLLIFFSLPETKPRTASMILAFSLLALPVSAQAPKAAVPAQSAQAQTAEQTNDTATTENAPEEGESAPLTAAEFFNAGLQEQQVNQDDKKAQMNYEQAISLSGAEPLVRASSYQNIGVISHFDARASVQNALAKVQGQDLDGALKDVAQALSTLNRAEELYCESMRSNAKDNSAIRNQQILLADRKNAENLKTKIEELKKLQEQAQQQTQQAMNQQQQENQQQGQQSQQPNQQSQDQQNQQNPQQSQNQEQQNQQSQQQSQQSQDRPQQNQEQNKSAQDKTEQAENTASELEQKASEMNQTRQEESAREAKEELQKARQEQQQGNGEKAEEHLQKALNALQQNQPQQDQDKQNPDNQQKADQDDRQDSENQQDGQQGEDQPSPQEQQAQAAEESGEQDNKLDKKQAEAILNAMAKDEKDLRDKLMIPQSRDFSGRVEKDW